MKKVSMVLIVMSLLLAPFNVMPAQAADVLSGDFYYSVNSDTTSVTITGYTDTAPRDHVVIPQTIDGKNVTAIGDDAFQSKSIQSLELPEDLISIGVRAFAANLLTSLEIPGNVKRIDQLAFTNNDLTSLTIHDGVENIGTGAFSNNEITILNLPDSVTTISNNAFASNKIESLTLPNNLEIIDNSSFIYNRLTSINIPDSVKVIGDSAFNGNRISELVIPSTVTTIEARAFYYNALTEVNFLGTPIITTADVFANQYIDGTRNQMNNWFADEAYTQIWNITVTSPLTIYAAYTRNTITFDTDGGAEVSAQVIDFRRSVTAVTSTKTGHTFDGWYKESTLTNPWNFTTDVIVKNITLYAKWIANTYTVGFNSNGGTAVANQTIAHDGIVTSPANPSKADHTFEGWYTDSDLKTAWNFNTDLVIENLTLYAKWTDNNYTVSFQSNGGSTVAVQEIASDGKVISPANPSKAGHTFEGWYTDTDLTMPWNFDTGLVKGNMTLYANWTVNTYTIDFHSNGGTAVTAQTIAYDNKIVSPTLPVKTGHIFVDWYEDEELKIIWKFDTDVVRGNTNLYAKWDKAIYKVTFDATGGSEVIEQQIAFEESAVAPTVPQKSGYTFMNWYKDEDLTVLWNFTTDVVAADTTLYAKWKKNNYVVTPEPSIEPTPTPTPTAEPEPEPIENVCPTVFSDVSNHWAEYAITDIASRCIIVGYPDGEFKPNAPLSRSHVALMITRATELVPNRPFNSYDDVSKNSPYYEAIIKVSQAGIFEGTNGYFYPEQQLTRAQMAKILVLAFNLPVGGKSTFHDVPQTHWASSYIATLESYGLAFGETGNYKPDEPVTRAQFIAFMYRALQLKSD